MENQHPILHYKDPFHTDTEKMITAFCMFLNF